MPTIGIVYHLLRKSPESDLKRKGPAVPLYSFATFQFDPEQRLLFRDGELVPLTPKAADLLYLLLEDPGRVVSKEQIKAVVWQDVYIEESNIAKNISLLRRTLRTDLDGDDPIRTISKRGYQFALPVTVESAADALDTSSAGSTAFPSTGTSLVPRSLARSLIAATVLLVLLIAAVSLVIFLRRPKADTGRAALAVLPFANLSSNPDIAWVSTALRETLVSDLDVDEALRVIPDDAVNQMQRDLALQPSASYAKPTLDSIHANLGCQYIISGTYLEAGGSLRVDAYLQDVRTGKVLSRTSFSRPAAELLNIIAQTGDRLRSALGQPPLPAQQQQLAAASIPNDPVSLQLYSQGLQSLRALDAPAALAFFNRLVNVDPTYPLVHAALSETYELMGEDKQAVAEAKIASDNAARLPREERLLIQANLERVTRHWPQAIAAQQTLWQTFPDNNDYGVRLAQVQLLAGNPQDAIATATRLERTSGRSDPRVYMAEASIRYQMGDYAAMRSAALEAERLAQAQQAHTLFGRARTQEGDALIHIGTAAQARAAFGEARSIAMQYGDKVGLMHALRRDGGALGISDPRASIPLFEQDCAIAGTVGDAREFANCRVAIGFAHQRLGEVAQARTAFSDALERSTTLGDRRLVLICLEAIGAIETQMAQWQEATKTLDSAEALAIKMKATWIHHMIVGDRGILLATHGHVAEGQALMEQAVSMAREQKDPVGIARELDKLSFVLAVQKGAPDAAKALQEECALWEKTGQTVLLAKCRIAAAELALASGDTRSAPSQLSAIQYDASAIVPGFAAARLKTNLALAARRRRDRTGRHRRRGHRYQAGGRGASRKTGCSVRRHPARPR
jgi:DNA-binding winged helix-turn-helix (wHTH) protein/TolB-like protein